MISQVPLLDQGMLARARLPAMSDSTLIQPWRRPDDEARLIDRSAHGLAALARAIAERLGRSPRVALPGWICSQALEPLRQTGAGLTYLPVSLRTGQIDWDAAERSGPFDILVVVHTFGEPVEMDPARALCARHDCFLVEDCAHALAPAAGIADAGDAVLFSPHKLFPLPEGAVLSLSSAASGWAADLDRALGRPPMAGDDRAWLNHRLFQDAVPDSLRRFVPQSGLSRFEADPPLSDPPSPVAPSDMARRLLAAADIAEETRRRRDNAEALSKVVSRLKDVRLLFPKSKAVPYRLALRADNPQVAAARFAALRQAHLPVESWPDLPPRVVADPNHADGAMTLRNTVLLLPVHGALNADDLARAYRRILK
ncbi:DegT/DnrJ/EryC1/StrS family aminotransferase [Magnetospirillum molischianum]|uniref:DegT/DnrJ/EryC1/StrS aminotransferase n=1 Tax=Magnetospirillum molischianum DSM 120 TaxID=1150626 RepID=H8FVZ6_MAGML|nr:DegT/DnrJ/EryC1/StrS family aminotransferase [Magnetospirillum molischianum]CCG42534.1 conserved hypothetical protein [Magnetospirillum molischianum DSM 120]